MTRIGVISDLHADVHALEDALGHLDGAGVDEIVCCGDLVDGGLFPDETLAILAARKIATIRGNHDRWCIDRRVERATADVSRASRSYLKALPTSLFFERDEVRVAVHHGSPNRDMEEIIPDDLTLETAQRFLAQAGADVLLVGHTHRAFLVEVVGAGFIANPAALLRHPADGARGGAPTGTFGVLEIRPNAQIGFRVFRAGDGVEVAIERRRLD